MPPADPIFIATKGTVLSLDRNTGRELWRTPLKGWDFVNLTLDDTDLFATTKGRNLLPRPPTPAKSAGTIPLKVDWASGLVTDVATPTSSNNTPALAQQPLPPPTSNNNPPQAERNTSLPAPSPTIMELE